MDTTDSAQVDIVGHLESDGEAITQTSTQVPKRAKRPKPPSEKKRVVKEDWGIPTLRAKDQNGKIIPVNSEKPVPIESESFKGFILIMVRTDGDQSEYNRYASHFEGKQRKFEVQFQVILVHLSLLSIGMSCSSPPPSPSPLPPPPPLLSCTDVL